MIDFDELNRMFKRTYGSAIDPALRAKHEAEDAKAILDALKWAPDCGGVLCLQPMGNVLLLPVQSTMMEAVDD